MEAIKITGDQGCIRVFAVGGIKLKRESWMSPVEELKEIINGKGKK